MSLLDSKKAQARNYFAVILFLVVFGFLTIFAYTFFSNFVDAVTTAGLYTGEVQNTGDNFLSALRLYDTVFVIMVVLFIIGVGITTFRLAATPIGFLITFILAAFFGFVSYFFNYVFAQMISPAVFNATIVFFPRTILLCTNLHWVMMAMIVVGSITLYGKKEKGQFLA